MRPSTWSRAAAVLLLLGAAGPAAAAFQDLPVSPQAAAMGGSALAARDSTALFSNPAELGLVSSPDVYFMYDQMYAGLSGVGAIGQGLLSATAPTRLGVFTAGVGTLMAQGLENEREIAFSYARRAGALSWGLTAKQLYLGYSIGGDPGAAADPVFANGTSRTAAAFDAGLAYQASGPLTLGLVVRNINEPDMGLASVDRVPRQIQASALYALPRAGLRLAADFLYSDQTWGTLGDRVIPSVGLEKAFYRGRAAFRLGVTSLGLCAGAGIRLGSLGLDYAVLFQRELMGGNFGTQMIGLRYYFGGASRPEAVAGAATAQPASLPMIPAFAPVRPNTALRGADLNEPL